VASTDVLATRAGIAVLGEGGNALDAAVAVAFALAVVNPEAGNLGGGGFFLIRSADGQVYAQDHRSTAPGAARPDMFWDADGGVTDESVLGHRAAAVPGSVRGLWEAHQRFGRAPWARLLEPAIGLAGGFEIRPRFLSSLPPHIVEGLSRFPTSASLFLVDGAPPAPGQLLRQPDLADSLRRIRDDGADGFYRGVTADRLVDEMRSGGGLITHADLAGYSVAWRRPVRFTYRDHTVWSMPPSSSGGVTLAGIAHALAATSVGRLEWHGPEHLHLMVEAWRRAFADRNHWLGDPDHVEVPMDRLLSPAYGARRGASIDPGRASRSIDVGPGDGGSLLGGADTRRSGGEAPAPREGRHTTHVSVVDADGMAAALTTTLNTWYGSKLVAAGTGVLLNNEMDDFTARPGVPNFFGLVQGPANEIAPGKRMLSAMTPTLVTRPDGRLRLVVGSPGGATIITTVFQVVSNVLDFGMSLPDAIAAPRVHHQHMPDRIDVEPRGVPEEVIRALEQLGHRVRAGDESWGDVEAIGVAGDATLEAVADPRRGGTAEAL
jgi:gamma-glutamyltranspeptidase/glutathione hydrolase